MGRSKIEPKKKQTNTTQQPQNKPSGFWKKKKSEDEAQNPEKKSPQHKTQVTREVTRAKKIIFQKKKTHTHRRQPGRC